MVQPGGFLCSLFPLLANPGNLVNLIPNLFIEKLKNKGPPRSKKDFQKSSCKYRTSYTTFFYN